MISYFHKKQRREVLSSVDKDILASKYDEFCIECSPVKNHKTSAQLRFYWGCVVKSFLQHMGELESASNREALHQELKKQFAMRISDSGKTYMQDVRDMTVDEFRMFIDNAINYLCMPTDNGGLGGALIERELKYSDYQKIYE